MTAATTSFREAVKTALKDPSTGLPGVDDVISGYLQGPLEKKTVVCVYPERIVRQPGNALVGQTLVGVRVLKKLGNPRVMPEQGLDPAPLEDLAEQLEAIVKANQTGTGPWYMELLSIDFDLPSWAIEASLVGWALNRAV